MQTLVNLLPLSSKLISAYSKPRFTNLSMHIIRHLIVQHVTVIAVRDYHKMACPLYLIIHTSSYATLRHTMAFPSYFTVHTPHTKQCSIT